MEALAFRITVSDGLWYLTCCSEALELRGIERVRCTTPVMHSAPILFLMESR